MPKEYSARTTLSDEYKETDIAIGLTKWEARINAQHANDGTNDMEVYCKWLKTEDFARYIAHSNDPDSIERVQDNILYNYSNQKGTLVIQYTDRDPVKAAQILDEITYHLQELVTQARQKQAQALYNDYLKERHKAGEAYHAAQERYARYSDEHQDADLEEETEEEKSLEKEVSLAYKHYEEVAEKCVRQQVLTKRATCVFAVVKPNVVPNEDNSHPIGYILSFVLIALSAVKGIRLYKARSREGWKLEFGGLFSPWTITLGVWGGMLLLFMLWGDELYPLTEQFYISITLWLGIMPLTSIVTYNLLGKGTVVSQSQMDYNKFFFALFAIFAIMLSPLFLYKVYQTVSMFDSKDMMSNVRVLAVKGEGQGFLNLAGVISQAAFLVSLWAYPKIKMWVVVALALCCITCSIAIMEKGTIFLVVICSMYVMFQRGVIKARTIAIVLLAIVGLFFIFNIYRSGEDSDYAKDETLLGFIGMYVMSPPVAYCTVTRDITDLLGINTFEVVYDYLQRFGFGPFELHEKLQEFVFVPVSTNVYTIMQPFYRDFGYIGVAVFAYIYGIMTGYVYRMSTSGVMFYVCFYTYLVEILILQFYQENLFLSMSFNIQLIVIMFLCTTSLFTLKKSE